MNHANTHDDDHRHLRGHGAHDSATPVALYNPEDTTTAQYRGSRRHGSPTPFQSACLRVLPMQRHVLNRLRRVRSDIDAAFLSPASTERNLSLRRACGSSPLGSNCGQLRLSALSFQPAQHVNRQVTDATPSHTKRRARLLRKLKRGKRNE